MKIYIYIFGLGIIFLPLKSFPQTIARIESVQSLYLEVYKDTRLLASATGFIIHSKTQNYLVTNYHVVTLKDASTKKWLDTTLKISPNKILIVQNDKILGKYKGKIEMLLDANGKPLWHENTVNNQTVDVIELPIKDTNDINIYPVNYKSPLDSNLLLNPTDRVFILGFPLGIHSEPYLPIWKSGLIASEPDIDQNNMPIIYVDAITYHGMSGSPVYYISNEINGKNGRMEFSTLQSIFMGVFSAAQVDNVFGVLWKAKFLQSIFDKLP